MEANKMDIVIEGVDQIIKRDLDKHKSILDRSKEEIIVFRNATAREIQKKKYYKSLIGGGKFNDESLRSSMTDINVNIRHMQDNVKITEDKIAFNTNIVDTLSRQLEEYYENLKKLSKHN